MSYLIALNISSRDILHDETTPTHQQPKSIRNCIILTQTSSAFTSPPPLATHRICAKALATLPCGCVCTKLRHVTVICKHTCVHVNPLQYVTMRMNNPADLHFIEMWRQTLELQLNSIQLECSLPAPRCPWSRLALPFVG